MIIKWKDTDTLLEIGGELVQFRFEEIYDIDTEKKPELTRFLRVKERQGGAEFIDLAGIATFESDPQPLDIGEPGEEIIGDTTRENPPVVATNLPENTPRSSRKNTREGE